MNRPRVKLTPRALEFVCPMCHHIEIRKPPRYLADAYILLCPTCLTTLTLVPGKPVDLCYASFTNLDAEEGY